MDIFASLSLTSQTRPQIKPGQSDPQSTTSQQRMQSKLAAAYENERKGYTAQAKNDYAELFWKTPVAESVFTTSASIIGHKPAVGRFMCLQTSFGPATANFILGKLLVEGHVFSMDCVIDKDYKEAMLCFRKAVEAGDQASLETLWELAQLKCPEANYQLALLYQDGKAIQKNLAEAERHFKIAADLGHCSSALEFARLCAPKHHSEHSSCLTHFLLDAIKYYEIAAKEYPKEARFELGLLYANEETKEAYQKALTNFELAQKAGNNQANDKIAALPKQIFDKAMTLFAARHFYNSNESQAVDLLEYAAELGFTDANLELAKIYESRSNQFTLTNSDARKALSHYVKVADSKPVMGTPSKLPIPASASITTPSRHEKVIHAKTEKVKEAAFGAGKMHEKLGNVNEALRYYTQAADLGHKEAHKKKGAIAATLEAKEKKEKEARVEELKKQIGKPSINSFSVQ